MRRIGWGKTELYWAYDADFFGTKAGTICRHPSAQLFFHKPLIFGDPIAEQVDRRPVPQFPHLYCDNKLISPSHNRVMRLYLFTCCLIVADSASAAGKVVGITLSHVTARASTESTFVELTPGVDFARGLIVADSTSAAGKIV